MGAHLDVWVSQLTVEKIHKKTVGIISASPSTSLRKLTTKTKIFETKASRQSIFAEALCSKTGLFGGAGVGKTVLIQGY